jgi:hypothetical protein
VNGIGIYVSHLFYYNMFYVTVPQSGTVVDDGTLEICQLYFTYIPLTLYPRRGSRGISDIAPTPTFYQNYLAVRNTADVTGGKPIAV